MLEKHIDCEMMIKNTAIGVANIFLNEQFMSK